MFSTFLTLHISITRRRHHCRKCGNIVCHSCSKFKEVLEWSQGRPERVCKTCMMGPLDLGNEPVVKSYGTWTIPEEHKEKVETTIAKGIEAINDPIKDGWTLVGSNVSVRLGIRG